MKKDLAELKIPASPAFIPVAKRVATTLGSQLGLSLVDLDELTIALTQACDSAIAAAGEHSVHSELKLTYFATNRALVVDVDLLPSERHMMLPATVPAVLDAQELANAELQRLAYEMIRCFVDDFRPEVEPSGHVRFRMVKYLAG
ncbi:MAG: ATP-binding protein [Chloroflexi bacterium]|nr:MAG: ATP-binding protein [Chloroflexota bacterium]TME91246.1 MAG: ATP-binding protein [Chloroflexota bacterium]